MRPAAGTAGTLTLSQAFEMNRRIGALKKAEIPTTCYIKETDGPGFLACAAADKIWINPAGGVRMAGLSTHALYFKSLLKKIGVKADIIRVNNDLPTAWTSTSLPNFSDSKSLETEIFLQSLSSSSGSLIITAQLVHSRSSLPSLAMTLLWNISGKKLVAAGLLLFSLIDHSDDEVMTADLVGL